MKSLLTPGDKRGKRAEKCRQGTREKGCCNLNAILEREKEAKKDFPCSLSLPHSLLMAVSFKAHIGFLLLNRVFSFTLRNIGSCPSFLYFIQSSLSIHPTVYSGRRRNET